MQTFSDLLKAFDNVPELPYNNRLEAAGRPVPVAVPTGRQADADQVNRGISDVDIPRQPQATIERQWRPPIQVIREQHPGVPIMPWPAVIRTAVAAGTNEVQRIVVPDWARLLEIRTSSDQIIASSFRFTLPLPASSPTNDSANNTTGPMIMPVGRIWECEAMLEIFVGLPAIGDKASIAFWGYYGPRLPGPPA